MLRLLLEPQHIRTEATEADTTMFVSIGACIAAAVGPSCGSQVQQAASLPRPMACAEAVSAAMSSPVASSAPPCMWRSACLS